MNTAPCKGCDKRYPGCHDRCPGYLSFKEEQNQINARRAKSNEVYYMDRDLKIANYNRGHK